nr:DUF11 domain-containing protein [Arenimonas sp.]
NDSCVNPSLANNGLHNSASLLQQAAGANPARNLSATACTDTKTPVWIRLNKTIVRRVLPSDQFEIRILLDNGSILTPLATALTSGSSTTASTGVIARPAGEILKLNESIKANGTGTDTSATNYRPNIACTNAGTVFTGLPSGLATNLGTNSAWTEFLPAAGADIDCTITNSPITGDLQISKVNNVTNLGSGNTTTYTIVASNNGPENISNAIVKDPASTGLSCTTASCSASGGSTCPVATGAALVTALQSGSGATVPLLTNGGSVSILLTCTVTATGF